MAMGPDGAALIPLVAGVMEEAEERLEEEHDEDDDADDGMVLLKLMGVSS